MQLSSNDLLNLPKRPPSRDDVTFVLGFSLCKSEIKVNCLKLFCKRARLGLLTPNLVFSLILCGQTMLATFCINRDPKISF
jgi:hypothetical protein